MSNLGKSDLTRIKNNEKFISPFIELLYLKEELTYDEANFLYTFVHILIQEYEKNSKKKYLLEYAYYITAITSFKINDFNSLYDLSINLGFYPLARKIVDLGLIEKLNILDLFANIELENFNYKDKILTYEQKSVFYEVLKSDNNSISFIAPTSYGKSNLIFDYIKQNAETNIIAIIVPTKSLINQVYNEFKNQNNLNWKVVMHDQNFNPDNDKRILAIITQERGLRLIEKGIVFDLIFIDEAHEIMQFDFKPNGTNRSLLLTRFIKISYKKNPDLKILYLSPLIQDSNNLRFKNQSLIETHRIEKDLKLYKIMYLDNRGNCLLYDRYLGKFIDYTKYTNCFEFINKNMQNKNLHFLYRPIYIEQYANLLFNYLPKENMIPHEIEELINELKELIHPMFKMTKYLEKGIVYLHAKIPLIIRNYIIMYVNKKSFIKHFVANSVILAGMNLPIDCLFYISGNANINDLINLMGRVNRLNEIFKKENKDLSKIFIPINFIELEQYPQAYNGSMKNKIEGLRRKVNDEVQNPLLENYEFKNDTEEKAKKIIKNEEYILDKYDENEFYIKLSKSGVQNILNYTKIGLSKLKKRIKTVDYISDENIMESLQTIFFEGFRYDIDYNPQNNAFRLQHKETIEYYKKFIKNMNILPFNIRIKSLVEFWKNNKGFNKQIYVGSSFGEEVYQSKTYQGFNKVYIDINKYINNDLELYNIAMIKIQIDEEFVSHEITILLNAMMEFKIINEEQYNYLLYGTNNTDELYALEIGISRNTFFKMKKDKQINNIMFDSYGNPFANDELINYINLQKGIYKFELESYFVKN